MQKKMFISSIAGAFLCGAVAVGSLTKVNEAKAVSQTTLAGSCGIIFTANLNGWEGLLSHYAADATNNAIGTINFDSGTYGFKFSIVHPYSTTSTAHVDETFATSTGSMTLSSFDSNTGVYEYIGTDGMTATTKQHITVLPVNSGNTFLITAYTETAASATSPIASGVCQKI